MQPKPLRVLIVDRDRDRAERLGAMLRTAPELSIQITHALRPTQVAQRGGVSAHDVAVLSLSSEEDPLVAARNLHAALPDLPAVVVDGDPERMDPNCSLSCGIQEHLPRRCAGCRAGSRLGESLRWAVERHRMTAQIESLQAECERRSLRDPLTGLPNRQLFRDRLQHTLKHADRHGGSFALLFLDLDRLKPINDSYGHEYGDLLLAEVSRRLSGCLRASDTAARWGGDEFTVLLPGVVGAEQARVVAEKILRAIAAPFRAGGRELSCGLSIGISLYPEHGRDAESLVRRADLAMYRAKSAGGDGFRLFEPDMLAIDEPTAIRRRRGRFRQGGSPTDRRWSRGRRALARWVKRGHGPA